MEIDEGKIAEVLADFRQDHGRLLQRLEDLERVLGELPKEPSQVPPETAEALREMALFFRREFLGHCREEELVLYPLLRPYVRQGDCFLNLVGQHTALQAQVEKFTRAVESGRGRSQEVLDQGMQLSRLAREHLRHEETTLFALAERRLR